MVILKNNCIFAFSNIKDMEVYSDNDFWSKDFWEEEGAIPEGEFDVVTETIGKTTRHQVYDDDEFDEYVCDTDCNVYGGYLGYLLNLVHEQHGKKCSFSWCKYKYDADEEEFVPCGNRMTVSGTYKDGVYKITIDDDDMRWLDDEDDFGV